MNTRKPVPPAAILIGLLVTALLAVATWTGTRWPVADNDVAADNGLSNAADGPRMPPQGLDDATQVPARPLFLQINVHFKNVPVPAEAALFVRSLSMNATTPVRLAAKPAMEGLHATVEFAPGSYALALGEDLALDHSVVHVSGQGYRIADTQPWLDPSVPLILVASAGYSLRIETSTEDGVRVAGSLKAMGFPDPRAIYRKVATSGIAMLYQVPVGTLTIDFQPEPAEFEPASVQFEPPADCAGKSVALVMRVKRKVSLTVRFVDPDTRHPPGTLFLLQVTRTDPVTEGGRPKARSFRLSDGAALPQDALDVAGNYSFAWVRDGAAGPELAYTRAELASLTELVLFPPATDATIVSIRVVDTAGKPLAGVELELTYQGPGWQKVTVTTDESGWIRVKQWDRKKFSLIVRPPTGVECTPDWFMNPADGDTFVFSTRRVDSRLVVRFDGNVAMLRGFPLGIRLWTPPDAPQKDWEAAVEYNRNPATVEATSAELRLTDTLADRKFEAPSRLWVVASAGRIPLGQWKLPDFLACSAQSPATLRFDVGELDLMTAGLALADLTGPWIVAAGRKSVAAMLCVALRGDRDPDLFVTHGATRATGGKPFQLACPKDCGVFTALGSDGTLVILRAQWSNRTASLHAEQTFAGGTLAIAGFAPRLAVTASYYQTPDKTMYWDEFVVDFESSRLPLTVAVPAGAPILILPLTREFGPTQQPLVLADHTYRADPGRQTEVRLR